MKGALTVLMKGRERGMDDNGRDRLGGISFGGINNCRRQGRMGRVGGKERWGDASTTGPWWIAKRLVRLKEREGKGRAGEVSDSLRDEVQKPPGQGRERVPSVATIVTFSSVDCL